MYQKLKLHGFFGMFRESVGSRPAMSGDININMINTGWWARGKTPLKNDGVYVNWDDEIPNISGKILKMATSHHQPEQFG